MALNERRRPPAQVSVVMREGGEKVYEREEPPVRIADHGIPPGRLGRLTVHGGVTQNMGDFNSVRIGVSLELPFDVVTQDRDRVFEEANTWVNEVMEAELRQVLREEEPEPRGKKTRRA